MDKIIHLKKVDQSDLKFLYKLLKQRKPFTNISHKKMPTFLEHKKFVLSKPYSCWYVVKLNSKKIGSAYLSKQDEIGIFVLEDYQNLGIGEKILEILMIKMPRNRYLANVSPKNQKSTKFFKKKGFKLIQHTYEIYSEELKNEKN